MTSNEYSLLPGSLALEINPPVELQEDPEHLVKDKVYEENLGTKTINT